VSLSLLVRAAVIYLSTALTGEMTAMTYRTDDNETVFALLMLALSLLILAVIFRTVGNDAD
jgi:hypothetical protein